MSNIGDAAAAALRHPIAKGWLVHCVTASGAICGMLGIIAVSDKQPREAVLWLAVAMVLDGVDGPAARAWKVCDHVPRIDGYTLDLIVDFVTCIVIPVIFLHQFNMLPTRCLAVHRCVRAVHVGAVDVAHRSDDGRPLVQRLPLRVEHDRADAVPAASRPVVHRRRLRRPGADAADELEVRAPDAGPPVPPAHHLGHRAVAGDRVVDDRRVAADKPAVGTALLIACPLYIVGIGVWRTIGHGALEASAAEAHLTSRLGHMGLGHITDVPGVLVGHYQRARSGWRTGTTVVRAEGAMASCDVRGGGPGTRETDLLDPVAMIDRVQAICLSGGSAYGLAAAHGAMRWHEERQLGFPVGPHCRGTSCRSFPVP